MTNSKVSEQFEFCCLTFKTRLAFVEQENFVISSSAKLGEIVNLKEQLILIELSK